MHREASDGDRAPSTPDTGAAGSNSRNKVAKNVRVNANFIQSTKEFDTTEVSRATRLRRVMNSLYFANFMVLVVLIDAYCTSAEIDARASGAKVAVALSIVSQACLILYTIEALVLLWISEGWGRFNWMTLLDWLIIIAGWVELLFELILTEGLGFHLAMMRSLRLVRIFRILRTLRRNRTLRELHKLAMMMATCFRTLLWSFLLCFIVMTVWAMLMVELIHPSVKQMVETDGTFSDCQYCQRAMSSVMDANLLLFKTVIAGDSWGEIAVPVIQEHPATAFIFAGSLLSLVFGVLNLIVAVVVDTFAEARQNDVQSLAEEMEDEVEHDRQVLASIFQRIDKDGSGELTLAELVKGAREDSIFHSRLRVMDIDEDDLQQLFYMIDHDNSGTVEVDEFIGPLSRWAHDSKTAPRFIKYNMLQTMQLQQDLYDLSVTCFDELSARMDGLTERLAYRSAVPGPCEPSETPDTQQEAPSITPAAGAVPESKGYGESGGSLQRAKITYAEIGLERVLQNLEMKLDLLMDRGASRLTSKSGGNSYSMVLASRGTGAPYSAEAPWNAARRPMRPMLHKEAFRQMYLRARDPRNPRSPRTSLGPQGTEGTEGLLGLASSSLGFGFAPRRRSQRSQVERSSPRSLATSFPMASLQSLNPTASPPPPPPPSTHMASATGTARVADL